MNKKHKMVFVTTALALQLLVLGWLILRYEQIVTHGDEVRFQCQAYDPYDPFLGRYLNTRVEEEVAVSEDDAVTTADNNNNGIVSWTTHVTAKYVRLIPRPDKPNLYCVAEAAKEPGDSGLWVKPESISFQGPRLARVTFPSKLYVNEKLARKADTILRENTEKAVAVYRVKDYEIVLIDIEIDGESIQKLAK